MASVNLALAALERYEADVRKLPADWGDMDLYARIGEHMDEIRGYCGAVPALSVKWIELLIANAELVHCIWNASRISSPALAVERQAHLEQVLACSGRLRNACLRHMTAPS